MGKFIDRWEKDLEYLEAQAKEAGSNLTEVCKRAGISRATPDRWTKGPPQTIILMDNMHKVIQNIRKEKGLPPLAD